MRTGLPPPDLHQAPDIGTPTTATPCVSTPFYRISKRTSTLPKRSISPSLSVRSSCGVQGIQVFDCVLPLLVAQVRLPSSDRFVRQVDLRINAQRGIFPSHYHELSAQGDR